MPGQDQPKRSFGADLGKVRIRSVILALAVAAAGAAVLDDWRLWDDDWGDSSRLNPAENRPAPPNWQSRQSANRRAIRGLAEGTPRPAVIADLGEPDFIETYDNNVELLFYRTSSASSDGLTNKRTETTPLVFRDGAFVTQGRYRASSRSKSVTSADWEKDQDQDRVGIMVLAPGAGLDEIESTLGNPDFRDRIGDRVEIWFYRTHRDSDDGRTDKLKETTPLVFIDETLVATDFAQPR